MYCCSYILAWVNSYVRRGNEKSPHPAKRDILRKEIGLKFFESPIFKKLEHNFVMTNRLISEKIASWDFVPPFDFAAQFLASRAARRGEHSVALASQKSGSPVWCPLFENARTFFERN